MGSSACCIPYPFLQRKDLVWSGWYSIERCGFSGFFLDLIYVLFFFFWWLWHWHGWKPGLLRNIINTLDVLCNFARLRRKGFGWDVAIRQECWSVLRPTGCSHQGAVRFDCPVLSYSSVVTDRWGILQCSRHLHVWARSYNTWSYRFYSLGWLHSITKRVCILLEINEICLLKRGV